MIRFLLAFLATATLPAVADTPVSQPPGAVTPSPGGGVEIAAPDCAALVAGAGYVPGVDVDGHAVAPADLPASAPGVKPETAAVEIDARLASQFGAVGSGAKVGRTIIGYVTVRDGRAYFNGAPLAPEADAALRAACAARK
jgi:hypothetical protein